MKITNVSLTKVAIPLRQTLRMGIDVEMNNVTAAVLELETDEGITGVAESPFDPERSEFELRRLRPRIIGQDPFNVEKIVGFDPFIGELYKTVSAIEIACWDIIGKKLGVPVYRLLGGRVWDKIAITAFMSAGDPDAVAQEAAEAVKAGITTIKLKLGLNPQQDLDLVRVVRQAVGDGPTLRIDPNQAWSVPTAISLLKRMEKYNLQYVEQPIPRWDHDGLVRLAQRTGVPICICEGLTSFPELMRLIKRDAISFVSSDPIRTGGLLGFKKLCGIAEAEGLSVIAHVPTFGISVATWLHALVSSRATMYAHDVPYPGLNFGAWPPVGDISDRRYAHKGGYLEVPEEPGLGVGIDRDSLAKWADYYVDLQSRTTVDELVRRYGHPNSPTPYFLPPRY